MPSQRPGGAHSSAPRPASPGRWVAAEEGAGLGSPEGSPPGRRDRAYTNGLCAGVSPTATPAAETRTRRSAAGAGPAGGGRLPVRRLRAHPAPAALPQGRFPAPTLTLGRGPGASDVQNRPETRRHAERPGKPHKPKWRSAPAGLGVLVPPPPPPRRACS